jgi:chromosome partitioning protein
VNLAAALAASGRTVLVIDLEADLNASISLGVRPAHAPPSIAELLLHERRAPAVIREVASVPNLHLIPGSPRLTGIDAALRHVRQPDRRLADVVRPLEPQFDAIVIDSPAGFSLLPSSVPLAAQHLVVPTRAEYLSLESLAQFLRWYHEAHARRAASARLTGIVLTMVDYRRHATREIVEIIRMHNRRGVFRTEIPQDPRAPEAPSYGTPLVRWTRSPAALAYEQLTREVLARIRRHKA